MKYAFTNLTIPQLLVPALMITAPLGVAVADDTEKTPRVTGSVSFEVQHDAVLNSDDAGEEFDNTALTIEPGVAVRMTENVSVNAGFVLEQVQEPAVKTEDRRFDDQGLYVETLTLDYARGPVALSGGKMGIKFGRAWDMTPGVFGTDLAEEYEMAENIALLAAYTHEDEAVGTHTLSAQTFFLDTSGLAESALTRRKKTREAAGGPGNTGDFSSFALALDGGAFKAAPGLNYHLGFVHQGNDNQGAESEQRFAASLDYTFSLSNDIEVQPLLEHVLISNSGGTKDVDVDYTTAALGFTYKEWNWAVSATFKETDPASGRNTRAEQWQISAGYQFPIGIGLDVGFKRSRNAGIDTDTVGTVLSYSTEF